MGGPCLFLLPGEAKLFKDVMRLLVVVGVVVASTISPDSMAGEDKRPTAEISVQDGGVRLIVEVPAPAKAGYPLQVKIYLANQGKEKVTVGLDRYRPVAVGFMVTDKKGKPVSYTSYGQKKLAPVELVDIAAGLMGSVMLAEVGPGERRELSIGNVARFYDLSVPGEYVLKVERGFGVGEGKLARSCRIVVAGVPLKIVEP